MKILRVNNLSTCVTQARKCLVYTAYHYCTCDCTHVQYSVCFCYKWHLWCYISNPLIICKSLLRYHIFGDEVESFLLWQPLGKLMNLTWAKRNGHSTKNGWHIFFQANDIDDAGKKKLCYCLLLALWHTNCLEIYWLWWENLWRIGRDIVSTL